MASFPAGRGGSLLRVDRSHSHPSSFGTWSGFSETDQSPSAPCCCGPCSCGQPIRNGLPNRSDERCWPNEAKPRRNWPHHTTKQRNRLAPLLLFPFSSLLL